MRRKGGPQVGQNKRADWRLRWGQGAIEEWYVLCLRTSAIFLINQGSRVINQGRKRMLAGARGGAYLLLVLLVGPTTLYY